MYQMFVRFLITTINLVFDFLLLFYFILGCYIALMGHLHNTIGLGFATTVAAEDRRRGTCNLEDQQGTGRVNIDSL